ncbi:trypco2 family protein [Litoreibacter halocynthiae]|uniref:trypco2 family protein n=1 Tax=Litoreibacter halocynthiae TaxID=1242689 RepID=UPI0024921D4F|nr:trypco2 family protein [Litoreibacter halocynthiae]
MRLTLPKIEIGLADLLTTLRTELEAAEAQLNVDEVKPRLFLDATEIEVAFSLKRTSEAKGGLKISVLGLGVEGSAAETDQNDQTHRVKITLKPDGAKIGVATS